MQINKFYIILVCFLFCKNNEQCFVIAEILGCYVSHNTPFFVKSYKNYKYINFNKFSTLHLTVLKHGGIVIGVYGNNFFKKS